MMHNLFVLISILFLSFNLYAQDQELTVNKSKELMDLMEDYSELDEKLYDQIDDVMKVYRSNRSYIKENKLRSWKVVNTNLLKNQIRETGQFDKKLKLFIDLIASGAEDSEIIKFMKDHPLYSRTVLITIFRLHLDIQRFTLPKN